MDFGESEADDEAGVTLNKPAGDDSTAEIERLSAARAGDEHAFEELTLPFRRELHVHCYRMLGNLADADDALQETLLRAWRHLGRFEPSAPFRAWLYRIATNVCLTLVARNSSRNEIVASDLDERDDARGQEGEPVQLGPYPDRLLDELGPESLGPDVTVERRESVELAFVAAVQMLPPRQRAALLLRDVIGYTGAEVATMLETSVAAVNSALQRARSTLEVEQVAGRVTRRHAGSDVVSEQALIRRLADAWHAADIAAIVSMLTEDALLTMPPQPYRYVGRAAIGTFLSTVPGGGRLDRFRLIPTRANRQPALAAYFREGETGPFMAYGIFVIAFKQDEIATIVRFGDPELIPLFGLPLTIDG